MNCPNCSKETLESNYCQNCGQPLQDVPRTNSSPSPSPDQRTAYQQSYQPVPLPYYPAYQYRSEQDSSRNWGIASVVMGFASLLIFMILFAPLGVVFGTISLTKQNHGNNLAILGIVLSLIGVIAAWVVLWV